MELYILFEIYIQTHRIAELPRLLSVRQSDR